MTAPYLAPNRTAADLVGSVQIVAIGVASLIAGERKTIDLTNPTLTGQIGAQQSIYVNNWDNAGGVLVTAKTGQTIYAPPYSIGWYALFIPSPATFDATYIGARATDTGADVDFAVCNAPLTQGPYFNPIVTVGPEIQTAIILSAPGTPTFVTGVAGQVIDVYGWTLNPIAASQITFRDGPSTNLTPALAVAAGGAFTLPCRDRPYFSLSAGNSLTALVAASTMTGLVFYTQGP